MGRRNVERHFQEYDHQAVQREEKAIGRCGEMEVSDEEHGHARDVLEEDHRHGKNPRQEEDQPRIAVAPRGMREGRHGRLELFGIDLMTVARKRGRGIRRRRIGSSSSSADGFPAGARPCRFWRRSCAGGRRRRRQERGWALEQASATAAAPRTKI